MELKTESFVAAASRDAACFVVVGGTVCVVVRFDLRYEIGLSLGERSCCTAAASAMTAKGKNIIVMVIGQSNFRGAFSCTYVFFLTTPKACV